MGKYVIVFGGASDATTQNVMNNANSWKDNAEFGKDVTVQYYSWTNYKESNNYIKQNIGKNDKLVIVGHSYGGDTAYLVARDTSATVELLVTIDPVSRFTFNVHKRNNMKRWLNVYADKKYANVPAWISPGANLGVKAYRLFTDQGYRNDSVATAGGYWGKIEKPGIENHSANTDHGDFRGMVAPHLPTIKKTLGN